jgi:hypothetical protein
MFDVDDGDGGGALVKSTDMDFMFDVALTKAASSL